MIRIMFCALLVMLPTFAISGETAREMLRIFDAACVGTALDPEKVRTIVEALDKPPLWRSMRATAEMQKQLKALIIGEEKDSRDWIVGKVDVASNSLDSIYVVHAGKRLVDGSALNVCAVTARHIAPSPLKTEIENAYRVTRVLDETQGLSRITGYSVDLIGLPRKYAISIQEDIDESKPSDLVVLSISETRP